MRKRLRDCEAESLGLDIISNNSNGNPKYTISEDQWNKVQLSRSDVVKVDNKTETKPNDYNKSAFVLSAWSDKGRMLSIDEYCIKYNLPKQNIGSCKLITHTGTPYYNIVFRPTEIDNEIDFKKVRKTLSKELKREYKYKVTSHSLEYENVLKWSDLHFGAYIRNVMHVKDFDRNILLDGLNKSVDTINALRFKKNHIHINGDLIESFSGLNHINSWQSMETDLIGANVVKLCSKMLHQVFKRVNNLGCIKIVAGNHDRTSKDNNEDVKGGAAELIAFCLELMGYDVEFHPYVITHFVDGINHINLHGDKGISKKSTEKIILDYGIQGQYNLINEGHLHSVIEKLSIRQRESFEVVKDDSILHRRFYLPSFFPGNYYSATLGYTTNPGYYSVWSDEKNRPQFFNGSV